MICLHLQKILQRFCQVFLVFSIFEFIFVLYIEMTEALFLKEGFIKANAPLKNGLGRFIPQLMRITIKFCKESPTSAGVR